MTKPHSGASLLEAIKAGDLVRPFSVVGLARVGARPDSLEVDPTLSCRGWVSVPTSMLPERSTEVVGWQHCGDHEHPVVRISLEEPSGDTGRVFYDLLRSSTTPSASLSTGDHLMSALLEHHQSGSGSHADSALASRTDKAGGRTWQRVCTRCIPGNSGHPFAGQVVCCDVRRKPGGSWWELEYKNCTYTACTGFVPGKLTSPFDRI